MLGTMASAQTQQDDSKTAGTCNQPVAESGEQPVHDHAADFESGARKFEFQFYSAGDLSVRGGWFVIQL